MILPCEFKFSKPGDFTYVSDISPDNEAPKNIPMKLKDGANDIRCASPHTILYCK